jgi:hypothetical protein
MQNSKTFPAQLNPRKVNQNLLLLGMAVLTVIPVLIVRFLPMQDYPQWLFQAHVIAHFSSFANTYSISWTSIPNLGSTLPLLALTPLFGAEAAGKILRSEEHTSELQSRTSVQIISYAVCCL